MTRNPIERALGVWSTANYRDVMLPGLGAVTCGELCDAIAAERALAERAGGVKEAAQKIERLWSNGCHDVSWRQHFDAAMEELRGTLTTEPATPEGRQEAGRIGDAVLDWMVKFDLLDAGNEYYVSDVLAVLNDLTPSTRPSEQAVTEAMVERLAQHLALDHIAIDDRAEYSWDAANEQWRQSWRRKARAALKAAMEAGR